MRVVSCRITLLVARARAFGGGSQQSVRGLAACKAGFYERMWAVQDQGNGHAGTNYRRVEVGWAALAVGHDTCKQGARVHETSFQSFQSFHWGKYKSILTQLM
jgi:hypothetical protein